MSKMSKTIFFIIGSLCLTSSSLPESSYGQQNKIIQDAIFEQNIQLGLPVAIILALVGVASVWYFRIKKKMY